MLREVVVEIFLAAEPRKQIPGVQATLLFLRLPGLLADHPLVLGSGYRGHLSAKLYLNNDNARLRYTKYLHQEYLIGARVLETLTQVVEAVSLKSSGPISSLQDFIVIPMTINYLLIN